MQKILPYLMLASFMAILVVAIIYVSRRFAWMLGAESSTPYYLLFTFIPLYFITSFALFTNATEGLPHTLYLIAAFLVGLFVFLVLSFLCVDLLKLFIAFTPRNYMLLSLGLATLVSGYSLWNAFHTRVTEYDIPLQGLNEDIKAVHLSDIHIGHFRTGRFLDHLIAQTNAQSPDVIFITGDYLDSKYALEKAYFEPLKQFDAPVYFVDGNHDHATGNASILAMMRSVGVQVLENQIAHHKSLQIVGLTHMLADRKSFDVHASAHMPTVEETLHKLNPDQSKATVLLHHAPNGIRYAQHNGIDLYLAGHTHAGQIFPFNFIADWMFEYNRGLNDYKGTKIVVSEGVGTFGPPFRLGTRSEVIVLNLKSKH